LDKLGNLQMPILGVWIRGDGLLTTEILFIRVSMEEVVQRCIYIVAPPNLGSFFQSRMYRYSSNVHSLFQPSAPAFIVASNVKPSGL
jgi:hypothetical protein